MRYDPYDARIVFDDLREHAAPPLSRCVIGAATERATRSVLRRARAGRLAVPLKVEPAVADTTVESFQVDGHYEVLGVSADTTTAFPIYAATLRSFQFAQPAPKFVRLDTPGSYAQFREARRARCCADLDARLRVLEETLSQHIADRERHQDDGFEFGDYSDQDVLGAEVARLARQSLHGGTPIPVVPALRGKVECWQDGEEICCTVRFLDSGGDLALATTGTPAQRHLEEALRDADVAELEHVLPVLDRLVQILGSTALIPELCRVAPIFSTSGRTSPMIGVMSAQSTPEIAAAMALLQRCQQGDPRARAEVCVMAERGGGSLLAEAGDRLARAQCEKARSRRAA